MVTEPLPVLFAKLQAVHLRHYNIQNQQLEIVLLCQFPTSGTVISDIYLMPELPQASFYKRGDVYLSSTNNIFAIVSYVLIRMSIINNAT